MSNTGAGISYPSINTPQPSVKTSREFGALAAALAKAQGNFPEVTFDSKVTVTMKSGGQYDYEYASLASIMKAIRKPLSEAGVAIMSIPQDNGAGRIDLVTLLMYENQWIESRVPLLRDASAPQQLGSQISYIRRYCVSAMLSIATEADDDGRQAEDSGPTGGVQREQPRQDREPAEQPKKKKDTRPYYQQFGEYFRNQVVLTADVKAPAKGLFGAAIGILDILLIERDMRVQLIAALLDRPITTTNDMTAGEKYVLVKWIKPGKPDEAGEWQSGNDALQTQVSDLLKSLPEPEKEEEKEAKK